MQFKNLRWVSCTAVLALLLATAFSLLACSSSKSDAGGSARGRLGPLRSYALGFSSTPSDLNSDAYQQTFKRAGQNGELVMIQRPPPWQDFLPGSSISDRTRDTTALEKRLTQEAGVDLLLAVDLFDAQNRGQLAALPTELRGKNFTDAAVHQAFLAYAKYLALNYKPAYLALGLDVNTFYEHNPQGFEAFVDAYVEAYDAIKNISPGTRVLVTFQLEDMQSLLPWEPAHPPDWTLIGRFQPKLDILAVSSYPGFIYKSPAEIPSSYYTQLTGYTSGPIAIAGAGYASGTNRQGVNEGTEDQQERFLSRLLADADAMPMAFVIWFTSSDLAFSQSTPAELYSGMGLLRADGSGKPAWRLWQENARRPLAR